MITHRTRAIAWLTLPLITLNACSSPIRSTTSTNGSAGGFRQATVTNCGRELTLLSQAKKMYVNDDNIIVLALAAGGTKEITAVNSAGRDVPILKAKHGTGTVNSLNDISKDCPTFESTLANTPDLVVAGQNCGSSEGKNPTPDILSEKGIPSYPLAESCRQESTTRRGIVDSWEAVHTDVINLGTVAEHGDVAKTAVDDIDARLKAVQEAMQPGEKLVVFPFNTVEDSVFTNGKYGAPQTTTGAAGGASVTADVEDIWINVDWERLATANPDVVILVEYPAQSYQEKIDALKLHSATKDPTAVKEERSINLPYVMWTENPLNIDATEYLRKAFEKHGLAPASDVSMHLEMPIDLPERDKLS